MTDEEKIAVLRQQATGLLDQITNSEGRSAEKAGLQLDFEHKKNQIYDLNQKITADTAAAAADLTDETAKQPGLLGKIDEFAQSIKKGFKEMGVSLKGAGLGLIFAEVISLGKEAVQQAQDQRTEYEKLGKPLDAATKSMAVFGDTVHGVKQAAVDAVGFLVSGYTQLGDLLGSAINRLRGINEAQENIAEAAQRAADAATERLSKLQQEQHDTDKIAAARKALADLEQQSAYDLLSTNGKIVALTQKFFDLTEQINHTEEGTVAYYERKKALVETTNQLHELGLQQTKEEAEQTAAIDKALTDFFDPLDKIAAKKKDITDQTTGPQLDGEQAVTEEIRNQTEEEKNLAAAKKAAADAAAHDPWQNGLAMSVTGAPDYASQSTSMLQGTVDKLSKQLGMLGSDGRTELRNATIDSNYGDWLTAQLIQKQIAGAQGELSLRSEVVAYDKRYGDSATAAQYGDSITSRSLQGFTTEQQKTNTVLQTLTQQLALITPAFRG